jgi:hypothetical protein
MSIGITAHDARLAAAPKYFGSSAPQRTFFVALISVLAWTLAVLLVVVIRLARPPYPLSALLYFFVVFHLMPWAVGLRNLRSIRKKLDEGVIDTTAAHLSYSMVLGMLANTYVVLCSGEVLAMLASKLGSISL